MAEGLIDQDADIAALAQPTHAERVEHLLTIVAMVLSRRDLGTVAPWAKPPPEHVMTVLRRYRDER